MADPRNFDEFYNGDRAFIMGGQTFHWRPLHWREWGELIDRRAAEEVAEQKEREEKIEALMANGKKSRVEAEEEVDDATTLVESFQTVIERITVYLEPDEVTGFRTVLDDQEKRISIAQLNALMVWLQEVQTPDRPTETLSSSSSGPGTQGAISPAA